MLCPYYQDYYHKVDGPNQGQIYTIPKKWTDPTKVKFTSPQSGRIPPRVNTVHKVDEPNQGQTYKSTKWTNPTKGQHGSQVDGPNQGQTYKITKWTDPTKGQHGSQSGRTQPGSNL